MVSGDDRKRPSWVPEGGGDEFATTVVVGGKVDTERADAPAENAPRRRLLTMDEHVEGVLAGNRTTLGRTITLVESNSPQHAEMAQEVLGRLLPHTGRSVRVGVTGIPGAGKSTLIECLGNWLCDRGHRVAVLAIDPSSQLTGGSILGDKTRMEQLGRRPEAFIRPSPTGGTLGGVTRKSRETLLVCEAAGYDVILIETVGVGQSEATVRSMVDFFLLLLIAGAGDELQGMKRGVMELADTIVFNKADGENRTRAEAAAAELGQIIHYFQPATAGWTTDVRTCSALTGAGVPELWTSVERFREITTDSGVFEERRRNQTTDWVRTMVREHLDRTFFSSAAVKSSLPDVERSVRAGELSPTLAVHRLIAIFEGRAPSKPPGAEKKSKV